MRWVVWVTVTIPMVLSPARTREGQTLPSPRTSEPSCPLSWVELMGNMKSSAPVISGKIKKCTERKNTFIHGQELGQTFYLWKWCHTFPHCFCSTNICIIYVGFLYCSPPVQLLYTLNTGRCTTSRRRKKPLQKVHWVVQTSMIRNMLA